MRKKGEKWIILNEEVTLRKDKDLPNCKKTGRISEVQSVYIKKPLG